MVVEWSCLRGTIFGECCCGRKSCVQFGGGLEFLIDVRHPQFHFCPNYCTHIYY